MKIKTLAFLFIVTGFTVRAQMSDKPLYAYLHDFAFSDTAFCQLSGRARVVSVDGREGLNTTSIRSVVKLKKHNLNEPEGSVSMWVCSLEDLSDVSMGGSHTKSNPYARIYPLLSDCPNPQNYAAANFKFVWQTAWHPSIIAQFASGGNYEEAFRYPHRAVLSSSHFNFLKNKWYLMTLTWDYEKDDYRMFANGVLIARENTFYDRKFHRDRVGDILYLGNPTLCYSDIQFHRHVIDRKEAEERYKKEAKRFDSELNRELRFTYYGEGRKPVTFRPDKDWKLTLDIPFNQKKDLESFYIQGSPEKVEITSNGLLVETTPEWYTESIKPKQVYLWSMRPFEGDIYVELEFNSLREGGLALLMIQASGMNREDFMADYPWRTTGTMTMVYGEDVRNYHLEFYREMADMRTDNTHAVLFKNPFAHPMSFGCLDKPFEKNKWHKLQLVQQGNRIVGALDGIIMVDATDDAFASHGPVYNFGRVALRCMLHSKMLFRNLKIYNKAAPEVTKTIGPEFENYKK